MGVRTAVCMVTLLALLAGCLGGDEPRATVSPTQTTTTTAPPPPLTEILLLADFGMLDCAGMEIGQLVELAAVQRLLPDGFTAKELTDPATGQGTGRGLLLIDFYQCQNFTTSAVSLEGTWFGRVLTEIEAPLGVFPDAPADVVHQYAFRLLRTDDLVGSLWDAAGYDTYHGGVDAAFTQFGGLPGFPDTGLEREAEMSVGDYTLQARGPRDDTGDPEAPFVMYTQLFDGSHLVWNGTARYLQVWNGIATASLAADDPFWAATGGQMDGLGAVHQGLALTGMWLVQVLPSPMAIDGA